MTVFEWLRERLEQQAGVWVPPGGWGVAVVSIEELRRSEWSGRFEGYMRNRLVIGALRYGRLHDRKKPRYDRVKSIVKRLRRYQATGSLEMLVDVANLALLEFEEGEHPLRHWESEDDGEHVEVIHD